MKNISITNQEEIMPIANNRKRFKTAHKKL
jgi:hypothetical protein